MASLKPSRKPRTNLRKCCFPRLIATATLAFLRGQGIEQEAAAITIKDAELLHLARDAKVAVGKALPIDVLLLLPDIIARPMAILWDKQDNAVLHVFDPVAGDARQGKVVVRVNYSEKSRVDGKRISVTCDSIRWIGEAGGFEYESIRNN